MRTSTRPDDRPYREDLKAHLKESPMKPQPPSSRWTLRDLPVLDSPENDKEGGSFGGAIFLILLGLVMAAVLFGVIFAAIMRVPT